MRKGLVSIELLERLGNDFKHHPPKDKQQILAHEAVRSLLFSAAVEITTHCPESRELALALTKIEEAMFWANAALARNQE